MANKLNLDDLLYEEYDKPVTCEKCGGGLDYLGLGEYACNDCGNHQFDDYGKVRLYLEKNPKATVYKVEAATGVSIRVIHALIRDGKFELKP